MFTRQVIPCTKEIKQSGESELALRKIKVMRKQTSGNTISPDIKKWVGEIKKRTVNNTITNGDFVKGGQRRWRNNDFEDQPRE